MNTYWWRLSRLGWLAGAAGATCGIVTLSLILHWADDVTGTVFVGQLIGMVLATAVAAPLRDLAAAVLDATAYPRRRRRLAPLGCALLLVGAMWLTVAAAQAARVPDVPWGGLAVEAAAMAITACAAGVWCAGRADPGLVGTCVLALIVLVDATTALGPWLTAGPGPRWAAGRATWVLLAATAAGILLLGLRDPGRKRGRPTIRSSRS